MFANRYTVEKVITLNKSSMDLKKLRNTKLSRQDSKSENSFWGN
jgi:hypothetical protein